MSTVYVQRDENKAIKGVYSCAQPGYATEGLPDTHTEVVAFRAKQVPVRTKQVPVRTTPAEQVALLAMLDMAMADNAAFLALLSPTPPQTAAQVASLTRQVSAVLKRLTQL